jgi:hypothetical protein
LVAVRLRGYAIAVRPLVSVGHTADLCECGIKRQEKGSANSHALKDELVHGYLVLFDLRHCNYTIGLSKGLALWWNAAR